MDSHLPASESEQDSDIDWDCPLCMEEMDLSDQNFRPCPCGYQVCRFCWHRIRENGSSSCPACRRIYSEDSVEFTPVSADVLAKAKEMKRVKEKRREAAFKEAATSHHGSSHPATTKVVDIISSRRAIADYRVIQRNLVYVIGVSPKIAAESILRSYEFFGQYGSIIKIVVNKRNINTVVTNTTGKGDARSDGDRMASASAYVTYQKAEDAAKAIAGIDGSIYDGRVIRATYGTTKYCSFYLRGLPCPNSGCMYLHEQGELADSYTKEQLSVGNHHLHSGSTSREPEKKNFGENERVKAVEVPKPITTIPESKPVIVEQPIKVTSPTLLSSINVPPISVDIDDFFARLTRTISGSASSHASTSFDLLSKTRDTLRSSSPAPIGHSRPLSTTIFPKEEEDTSSFIGGSSVLGGVIWNRYQGSKLSRSPSPPVSNEDAFAESRSIDQFFSLFKTASTDKATFTNIPTTTTVQVSPHSSHSTSNIASSKIALAKREPVTIKTPDNKPVQFTTTSTSFTKEIHSNAPQAYYHSKEVPLIIPPSPSKVILKKAPLDVKIEPKSVAKESTEFVSSVSKAISPAPVQILQRQESPTPLPPTSKQQQQQQPTIGTRNLFSLLQTDASSSSDSSEDESDIDNRTVSNTNSTTHSNNTSSTQTAPNHKKTPSISPPTLPNTITQQQNVKSVGKKNDADVSAEIKRLESALSANMAEVGQLESQLRQLMLSQQNKK